MVASVAERRSVVRDDSPFSVRSWSPLHLVPVTRVDKLVVIVTTFVLYMGLPAYWFLGSNERDLTEAGAAGLLSLMMLAAATYAVLSLRLRFGCFVELCRAEPLLPAFLGWCALSTVWSVDPGRTIRSAISFAAIGLVGFWFALRFPLAQLLRSALIGLLCGQAINVCFSIALVRYGRDDSDRWAGVYGHHNILARSTILVLIVSLVLARSAVAYRRVYWLLALGNLGIVLMSQSKTSSVAAVSLILLSWVSKVFKSKRTAYGAVTVAFGGVGLTSLVVGIGRAGAIAQLFGKSKTISGRSDVWKAALDQIWIHPIQGFGWSAFWAGWDGPSAAVWHVVAFRPAHAHNAFLGSALEIGLVGAVIATLMLLRLAIRSARLLRHYSSPVGMFPLMFVAGALPLSITEAGVITKDAHFLFYVVAIVVASCGRRQFTLPLTAPGARND